MSLKSKIAAALILPLAGCGFFESYQRPSRFDAMSYASRFSNNGISYEPSQRISEPITPDNIIRIAVENSPTIRAGLLSNEYVENLSKNTETQYLPRVGVRTSADLRHRSVSGLGQHGFETDDNYFGQVFLSQKLPWGFNAKVYGDYDQQGNLTSNGAYGAELSLDLPGSARLARQRVNDLLVLQEPAKDLANFTAAMRSTLESVVSEYYGILRGNTDWLGVTTEVELPYLTKIKEALDKRLELNPEDKGTRSSLSALEGKITKTRNLIDNEIPTFISDARRNLEALIGVNCEGIDPRNITDDLPEIPYQDALIAIVVNDSELRRYQIEIDIAMAQLDSAGKIWDVSLFGGTSTPYHGDIEQESYIGIQGELSTDIFGRGISTARGAHSANARSFTERSKGRIDLLALELSKLYAANQKEKRNLEIAKSEKQRTEEAFDAAYDAFVKGDEGIDFERIFTLADDHSRATLDILNRRKAITINKQLLRVRMGLYDKFAR